MRLATISMNDHEQAAICAAGDLLPLETLNKRNGSDWPTDLLTLIRCGRLPELQAWYDGQGEGIVSAWRDNGVAQPDATYAPLYRDPAKIWGIGLNYAAHAADLAEKPPQSIPGSFMKPTTSLIGYGDTIEIPHLSQKTTAEAELAVVIGKRCKDVPRDDWRSVVAGFTTVIDMTAEDILRLNPRYLTVCKSFDTFFSFGPQLITPDEVKDVNQLEVRTVINGRVHARNVVSNMTFPPDELVAFHSRVMTLLPGDIISTGTPGAVQINNGDMVRCEIDGFKPLMNPVRDLKTAEAVD